MKRLFIFLSFTSSCVLIFAVQDSTSIAKQAITFPQLLLGSYDLTTFFGFLFFALVGVLISLLWQANTRDQNTTDSPVKFKWWFLLKDNWKRIISSILLIYVTIRFFKELTHLDLNMFLSLCIGLGWDKLSEFIKSKTDILKVERPYIKNDSQPQT
jgi:hypothetical protein